jgi:hypothetical protein
MFTWVHLCQWGDAIDVMGDADTKRLGTPGPWYVLFQVMLWNKIYFNDPCLSGMVLLEQKKCPKFLDLYGS